MRNLNTEVILPGGKLYMETLFYSHLKLSHSLPTLCEAEFSAHQKEASNETHEYRYQVHARMHIVQLDVVRFRARCKKL
jgi:hypothetical protein